MLEEQEKFYIPRMHDGFDDRLNQYRSMWLFVYFDLPTETRKERKIAADFRKMLMGILRLLSHHQISPISKNSVRSVSPNIIDIS